MPNLYIHNQNNKSNGKVQFKAVTTNIVKIHLIVTISKKYYENK